MVAGSSDANRLLEEADICRAKAWPCCPIPNHNEHDFGRMGTQLVPDTFIRTQLIPSGAPWLHTSERAGGS